MTSIDVYDMHRPLIPRRRMHEGIRQPLLESVWLICLPIVQLKALRRRYLHQLLTEQVLLVAVYPFGILLGTVQELPQRHIRRFTTILLPLQQIRNP